MKGTPYGSRPFSRWRGTEGESQTWGFQEAMQRRTILWMLASPFAGLSSKMPTWFGTQRNRMCTFTTSIRYGISQNARPHSDTDGKHNGLENNSGQRVVRRKQILITSILTGCYRSSLYSPQPIVVSFSSPTALFLWPFCNSGAVHALAIRTKRETYGFVSNTKFISYSSNDPKMFRIQNVLKKPL